MFYSIPNLGSQVAREMPDPVLFKPTYGVEYTDKRAFLKWSQELGTTHSFISLNEGMSPIVRIHSKDNPIFRMHGVIADYDAPLADNVVEKLTAKPQSDFKPSWLVRTISGNGRLVWLFETPVTVMSEDHYKKLIRHLSKQLHLNKWLAGLDIEALSSVTRYFEHGATWEAMPNGTAIPTVHIRQWAFECGKEVTPGERKTFTYDIPMDEVAAEVHKRFPGRWKGDFRVGAQGVRFWDPAADNPTGAWVREDGIYCFTGTQSFLSWENILGRDFVAKFATLAVGGIMEESAYNGREFFQHTTNGWLSTSKDDFSQMLRVKGFGKGGKKDGFSEIDKIEHMIKTERRIEAAFPFMFFKHGIIRWRNKSYLNISQTRCLTPCPPIGPGRIEWEEGATLFPFLHSLLTTMFTEPGDPNTDQLHSFLAWLKYFYVNSLNATPRQGQAVVLAGPAGKGKSLLTELVIGDLVGGRADATNHLVHGDQWTKDLADSAVMAIEDSVGLGDARSLSNFSNKLKKYVANPEILFNQKFKDSGSVPWFGRVVITCNLDSESLRIMPNMDISIRDKVSLFCTSNHIMDFPDRDVTKARITDELPVFARFLVDWVIPENLVSTERRFGVKAYHHVELMAESRQQGTGTLVEVLQGYLESYSKERKGDTAWVGLSTQLQNELNTFNPAAMREISCRSLQTQLGMMAKNGYGVYKEANPMTGVKTWRINYDLQTDRKDI